MDTEVPPGQRLPRGWARAKRLGADVVAERAARGPEPAQQPDHDFLGRALADNPETGAFEVGKAQAALRPALRLGRAVETEGQRLRTVSSSPTTIVIRSSPISTRPSYVARITRSASSSVIPLSDT